MLTLDLGCVRARRLRGWIVSARARTMSGVVSVARTSARQNSKSFGSTRGQFGEREAVDLQAEAGDAVRVGSDFDWGPTMDAVIGGW